MTTINPTVNVPRLIDLAHWLTEQERRRRLHQPSEWEQDKWVDIDNGADVIRAVEKGDVILIQGWTCGTAACAAGHISLEDGGLPAFAWGGDIHPTPPPRSSEDWKNWWHSSTDAVEETVNGDFMWFGDRHESIENHARDALGLTDEQARRLFDGSNDWNAMVTCIADLTGYGRHALVTLIGGDHLPPDPDEDEDDDGCDCDGCRGYRA